jgi:hypothetical protein
MDMDAEDMGHGISDYKTMYNRTDFFSISELLIYDVNNGEKN